MAIFTTHAPLLQSKAQLIILPMSADGNILHPVVARTKSVFFDNYDRYHKQAIAGELKLGDVLVCRIAKQHTGLGVQTSTAEYVANLIAQKSPEQPISVRTLTLCLNNLKPKLYELMRYQGVRRVAFLGSALLKTQMTDGETVAWLTPERILTVCHEVLGDVPKLSIEIYFGKDTPLPTLQSLSKDIKNT